MLRKIFVSSLHTAAEPYCRSSTSPVSWKWNWRHRARWQSACEQVLWKGKRDKDLGDFKGTNLRCLFLVFSDFCASLSSCLVSFFGCQGVLLLLVWVIGLGALFVLATPQNEAKRRRSHFEKMSRIFFARTASLNLAGRRLIVFAGGAGIPAFFTRTADAACLVGG